MSTFYKYADRTASDYVDWGKIASDLSSTLLEQKKIREDKKDAIDKANRESYNTLADAPTGEDQTYSSKAISYSNKATEQLLTINRLFKSGQMEYKDFLNQRQNIMDDTNVAFGLFKDYQTEYADKMKRMNDNTSHGIEQFAFGSAEGYGNMNDYDFIIDPTTSRVYLGKMTKDKDGVPVLDKNPSNYAPVQSLKARVKTKVDRFDADAQLKKGVDMMGKEIQATKQYGRIDYFADITKRKATGEEGKVVGDYLKSEDLYISSLMSPMNAASVLTDYLKQTPDGKQYKYTWDKAEADADKSNTTIYVEQTTGGGLKPVLNQAQMDVAKEAMKSRFRIMLDREHKIDAVTEPQPSKSATSIEEATKRANLQTDFSYIYNLRNGEPSDKQSAANALVGLSEGTINKIDTRDPSGVTIYFADGRKQKVSYSNNLQNFADGLTGITADSRFSNAARMHNAISFTDAPTTHIVEANKAATSSTYDMANILKSDNKTIMALGDYFDQNIEKGVWDTDESVNNNLSKISTKVVQSLPADVKKGANVRTLSKNGIQYTRVVIPNVGEINIPASQSEKNNDYMKAAIVMFHDAVADGGKFNPADAADAFKDNEWFYNSFKAVNNITDETPTQSTKPTSQSNGSNWGASLGK